MTNTGSGRGDLQAIVDRHFVEQFARNPSEADPASGLDQLHERLSVVARVYEEGPSTQRQAVSEAILSVAEFLKEQGFSDDTLTPLMRVVWAFANLRDQNRPDPLFTEKRAPTKAKRSMEDAIRQGHLAAFATVWLNSQKTGEGDRSTKLGRGARQLSGYHFGKLSGKALSNAMNYQRQTEHHELLYQAFEQMMGVLTIESDAVGGGEEGLRLALKTQINALNLKAKRQL